MPWHIRKLPNGKFAIIKSTTGKQVGQSDTKEKAQASIRARWAGENKKRT